MPVLVGVEPAGEEIVLVGDMRAGGGRPPLPAEYNGDGGGRPSLSAAINGESEGRPSLPAEFHGTRPDVQASENCRDPSELVHRMWLQLSPDGAANRDDQITWLPDLAMASLESFSYGYRQLLWCWQEAPAVTNTETIPWVELRDAETFLPFARVKALMAGGVHVAQVKDILQMHVLAVLGGTFVDLDVLWLGRKFPRSGTESGLPRVILHTEPDKVHVMSRTTSLAFDGSTPGVIRGAVSLGVMYAEPGLSEMREVAVALEAYWTDKAAKGTAARQPWMKPVTVVMKALGVSVQQLHLVSVSPMTWCPLPRWLREWNVGHTIHSFGCEVPSGDGIAAVGSASIYGAGIGSGLCRYRCGIGPKPC